jgi:hypothetical protein
MVDSQAEVFTTLAFFFAIGAPHPSGRRWFLILSGLFLGLAYDVRHTQVLLAPAILILVSLPAQTRAAKFLSIALVGIASLVVASPDLWYHHAIFGSVFHPESNELGLFSAGALQSSAYRLWDIFVRGNEFGWLVPLILVGVWKLAKSSPTALLAIGAWLIILVGFHLFYPAVRLRDLIPEFPPLAVLTAIGFVGLASTIRRIEVIWHRPALALAVFISLELLSLRVWSTVGQPFRDAIGIFGYMTTTQRSAFESIAEMTPENAIIGAGLNTGPLDLYSHRATVHPADWSMDDQTKFLCAAKDDGRPVYLLNDSQSMGRLVATIMGRAERLATLDVPLLDESEVGRSFSTDPGGLWKVTPECDKGSTR